MVTGEQWSAALEHSQAPPCKGQSPGQHGPMSTSFLLAPTDPNTANHRVGAEGVSPLLGTHTQELFCLEIPLLWVTSDGPQGGITPSSVLGATRLSCDFSPRTGWLLLHPESGYA